MDMFAPLPAEFLANDKSSDAAQPRPQFRGLAQLGQLPPRGQKSLLRQVFALGEAARGAVGQGTNQRLMPFHNLTEAIAAARQALRDQLGIVGLGGRFLFGCRHITA
jgi:hypothetical protein